MSQIWPSFISSKRTSDSTCKSPPKIEKLRISLGLKSPKSFTNPKTTPKSLISSSRMSSQSSVNKKISERFLVSSESKSIKNISETISKQSYRSDAAQLILSRIKRFIYKHFHIWRLSAARLATAEMKNNTRRSLVVHVNLCKGKNKFHSSTRTESLESANSPMSSNFQATQPMKLSELESEESVIRFEGVPRSRKDLVSKNFVFSKGSLADKGVSTPGKVSLRPVFTSAFRKEEGKKRGFSALDQYKWRKTLPKLVGILEKVYKKRIDEGFFTVFAVVVFKLNLLKTLAEMMKKVKRRMKGYFEDILKTGKIATGGDLFFLAFGKAVKKRLREGFFEFARANETRSSREMSNEEEVKSSYLDKRKSVNRICSSISRLSSIRSKKRSFFEKIEHFYVVMNKFNEKFERRVKRIVFDLVIGQHIIHYIMKGSRILRNIIERKNKSFAFFVISKIFQNNLSKTRLLSQLKKHLSKQSIYLCSKCFEYWKNHVNFFNESHTDLRIITLSHALFTVQKNIKKSGFFLIKFHRNQTKIKANSRTVIIKAVKRISKHLNFFKAKAFQRFKFYFPLQKSNNRESESVLVCQIVKILNKKVVRNIRFFFNKVSHL